MKLALSLEVRRPAHELWWIRDAQEFDPLRANVARHRFALTGEPDDRRFLNQSEFVTG
jgi:hypothetical protein